MKLNKYAKSNLQLIRLSLNDYKYKLIFKKKRKKTKEILISLNFQNMIPIVLKGFSAYRNNVLKLVGLIFYCKVCHQKPEINKTYFIL